MRETSEKHGVCGLAVWTVRRGATWRFWRLGWRFWRSQVLPGGRNRAGCWAVLLGRSNGSVGKFARGVKVCLFLWSFVWGVNFALSADLFGRENHYDMQSNKATYLTWLLQAPYIVMQSYMFVGILQMDLGAHSFKSRSNTTC